MRDFMVNFDNRDFLRKYRLEEYAHIYEEEAKKEAEAAAAAKAAETVKGWALVVGDIINSENELDWLPCQSVYNL